MDAGEKIMKQSRSSRARSRARRSAIQALYQWFITDRPMTEIITEFENERSELKKADKSYFQDILNGSEKYSADINNTLAPLLDRALNELGPVERAILHLGLYELKYQPELPYRVALNEAIELARMFGAEDSYKYINGVLDKAARQLREAELVAARQCR